MHHVSNMSNQGYDVWLGETWSHTNAKLNFPVEAQGIYIERENVYDLICYMILSYQHHINISTIFQQNKGSHSKMTSDQ